MFQVKSGPLIPIHILWQDSLSTTPPREAHVVWAYGTAELGCSTSWALLLSMEAMKGGLCGLICTVCAWLCRQAPMMCHGRP
jgi:hypothetical protein